MLPFPIPAELQKELEDKFKETVKAVLKWAIAQTGLTEKVKKGLGLDPVEKALQASLARAFIQFEHDDDYGKWIQQGFDPSFFEKEAAAELAKFLLTDGQPDPSILADAWASSFNLNRDRRTIYTRQLEPAAAKFLELFESQLKEQKALEELVQKRTQQDIAQALKDIRDKLQAGKATPGTRLDYLRWLLDCYQYIDLRGVPQTQRQVQLKLDEIYVSLQAQRDEIPGTALDRRLKEQELTELRRELESRHTPASEVESQLDELAARLDHKFGRSLTPETLDLSAVVADHKHNRLVILGDPGSGKSTLLKYLAVKHAQAALAKQPYAGDNLGVTRLPILLRISEYAVNQNWRNLSLSDFLPKSADINDCPAEGLGDLLATELTRGNCLVLLDGLDEIVTGEERAGIVDKIEKFVNSHSVGNNRFIVTSRFAGYSSAPLASSFVHYGIQDMSEPQIQGFLERWCRAVEDAQTPDIAPEVRAATARREINGIMASIKNAPGVKRLATNPLLLTILALIHRTGARLPQKRVDLYKLASDVLARYWREAKGIPVSAVLEDSYLNLLLSEMAYWLHTHRATGIATEREVYEVMGRELFARKYGRDKEWEEDNPEIRKDVSLFLQAVRKETGLFVERAPERYGFMHLTFEEYYVAKYLTRRRKDTAKLIHQHKTDPRWTEPILLALGLVGNESSDDAAEIIETAILAEGPEAKAQGFQPSEYEDLFGRDYRLALRCIGDMVTTDRDLTKRLGERLLNEYVYRRDLGKYRRYYQALEDLLFNLKGNQILSQVVSPLLLKALIVSKGWNVRASAAEAIGRLGLMDDVVRDALLKALLEDKDSDVRVRVAQAIGRLGLSDDAVRDALLKALLEDKDEEGYVRASAAQVIGQLGLSDDAVRDALLKALLEDEELDVNIRVAQALEQLELVDDTVRDALLQALLEDEDVGGDVRANAAQALGRLGLLDDAVRDALLKALLEDISSDVRASAAEAIGRLELSDDAVRDALLKALLEDEDEDVRANTAQALGQLELADDAVRDALFKALLEDTDSDVRAGVVQAIGQLGLSDDAVRDALLKALLEDIDSDVRVSAVEAIEQLGLVDDVVRDALLKALLEDRAFDVRDRAAEVVGQLGIVDDKVRDTLLKILIEDKDEDVRASAAQTIGELGLSDREVRNGLLKALLEDKHFVVRGSAAQAIGQLGLSDGEVQRGLLKTLLEDKGDKDEEGYVRASIAHVLSQLGRQQSEWKNILVPRLFPAVTNLNWNTPYQEAYDLLWQFIVGLSLD